jgi:hypothetical protein
MSLARRLPEHAAHAFPPASDRRLGGWWLYLQVSSDDEAALRLYERAGFAEVCAYHYRTALIPFRP